MGKNSGRWWLGSGALVLAILGLALAAPVVGAQDDDDEGQAAWLGVYTQSLTNDLREGIDYSGDGVLVNRVVSDSPADKAGIKKGDVITQFNNRKVDGPGDLARLVRNSSVGQSVSIQVYRDGERKSLSATLGSRDNDFDWDFDDDGENYHFRMPHLEHLRDLGDIDIDVPNIHFLSRRGRLGVSVQDLNPDLGRYFKTDKGALVLEVMEDTPADKAGIKAGDVITKIGDDAVDDTDDLVEALSKAGEGEVDVTVLRQGRSQSLKADIEQAPRAYRWNSDDGRRVVIRDMDRRRIRDRARDVRQRESDVRREVRELQREIRELQRKLDRLEEDK